MSHKFGVNVSTGFQYFCQELFKNNGKFCFAKELIQLKFIENYSLQRVRFFKPSLSSFKQLTIVVKLFSRRLQ